MSATTTQRALTTRYGSQAIPLGVEYGVKDNTVGLKGTIVVLDGGYLKMGVTGTGLVCVGASLSDWDNTGTGHADGAILAGVEQGILPWNIGSAGDALTQADAGSIVYIIDNQTVGKTDGSGTRSPAGVLAWVAANGTDPQAYVVMGEFLAPFLAASTALNAIAAITSLTDNSGGTASNTIAAMTVPSALTDNTGGTASTTLAAITQVANAGSADVGPVKNALAQFAASQAQNRAALVVLLNAVASLAAKVNAIKSAA